MPDLAELQRTASTLRARRDSARDALRPSMLQLQSVDQQLTEARRAHAPRSDASEQIARLERTRAELANAISASRSALGTAREDAVGTIGRLVTDPRDLVAQLDDSTPFLLLPVRIETKFGRGVAGDELWVRIFPDDISIAHHEKELTVGEKAAGEAYWRSRASANGIGQSERDQQTRAAWDLIALRYGAYRSSWIVRTTQPDNWTDTFTDASLLNFPVLTTKPLSWSDTPRSPVLPDRFAVILERGTESRTVIGNFIPDDLPLGPDPLQAQNFLTRDKTTGRLSISTDLLWLIDFKTAETVGMGVRIALTADEAMNGFDRILVLGLRLTADADEGAALLAQLLQSHRYSQGIAIVRPGTPTNNTDDTASGLTTAAESPDETFALEHDTTPLPDASEPMAQTDGQRLADALSLPADLVRALPNARDKAIGNSVAMQRALWSATLGNFASDMLEGAFDDADIAKCRLFFTEHVHGRGPLPALRVGRQPYGIVITSSFDDWAWSSLERGRDGDFWDRLQEQLGRLRKHWTMVANDDVRYVGKEKDAKGNDLDPYDTLINIIGLQASSVEYWSRTGVPDSYVSALASYRDNDAALVATWIANAKMTRVDEMQAAHVSSKQQTKLGGTLFLDTPDLITGPVVDGDPAFPLSETAPIRPYDGVPEHNYIHWLLTASSADMHKERFVGADGKRAFPPQSLLYKMLRFAMLAELASNSRLIAVRLRPDVFADAPSVDQMPNIREQVLLPGQYTLLDTAKIGASAHSMTTGDYLLDHARAATALVQKPPEAAPLAALSDALRVLAPLPTAQLERLFAEHVDVASYRLDAWLTGLFARRLKHMRAPRGGTYIGAFGWVEGVRPAQDRQEVDPAQIPSVLQSAVEGPVVTYKSNGGLVHAPSLAHAVTAAILRNAYLTHAAPAANPTEKARAERMAVNLSSGRVRTALRYIEGLQNGQQLSALLGYQIERGLHEGHPGVELDQYISALRDRFPLVSRKLTPTPDGVPVEVVEARHVVNGYDLLDWVKDKSYPYGIAGLPNADPYKGTPGAGATGAEVDQAKAIVREIDRLRDAMDAVADLLLCESVHQVVQGNYARARGAIQALSEGEAAALPDVVQTPRSGRSLTHRLTLFLDPAATTGWRATLTPRAAANAPLNHWLSTVLPPPSDIQWTVTVGTAAAQTIDMRALKIEPIDLVLMAGDRLGDLSSQLEQLLVYDLRSANNVGDEVATLFAGSSVTPRSDAVIFDASRAEPGKYSLGSLLPFLKALRAFITSGRALRARDLMRPTEAQNAHPENPGGYDGATGPLKDLDELKQRLEAAYAALKDAMADLEGSIAVMQPLADALEADPALAVQTAAWSAVLPQLRDQLRAIERFGVPEAMPTWTVAVTRPLVLSAFTQASAVKRVVDKRHKDARANLDIAFTEPLPPGPDAALQERGRRVTARLGAYQEAARLVLGSDFLAIPLFAAHPESLPELAAAKAAPVETDPLKIESWLQALSRVRRAMQIVDTVAMYREWLQGELLSFVPVQLPVASGAKWIGGVFSDTVAADDVVSIMMHNAPANLAGPMAGLLIDEWTELVPASKETTGIAININRPNAVAPQALLLAVPPKRTGHWAWSDLVAILHDTLARARLRAVEPDQIGYPYFQLLPPIVTAFNRSVMMPFASLVTSERPSSIREQRRLG
jgi:hypothetical protein